MAVVIPTCNRPFLLKNLVHNIWDQMDANDWIIIVNDGDPDSLPEFNKGNIYEVKHCKDYYAVASGRNRGMEKAIDLGYEWGLLLDDDIEVSDRLIEEHKSAWSNRNTAYVGKITKSGETEDVRKSWWNGKGDFTVKWGGCNVSFHLPSLMDIGGYDEDFDGNWGGEDNELYYRLVKEYGWKIEHLEDAVAVNLEAPENGNYQRYSTENRSKLKEKGVVNNY